MATLKDVARLAGVDASTASRVLRGDPVQSARPETKMRILDAASALRYRPNAIARGLRTRRTDTLGLIIPSVENVGFSEVMHGIQAAAAASGRLVMVVESDAVAKDGSEPNVEEIYSRLIIDGRVDGLIVAFATLDDRLVAQLADRGIPLVLVNRRTAGVHGSVVVDDERGSALAVEYLADLGHRHVGYVGLAAETDTALRRERGFRRALTAAGLTLDPQHHVLGAPTLAGGKTAVEELLAKAQRRPTAIFVASLLGAIGGLAGLRSANIAVPRDVSVVAFNDHELASHVDPPLTTVRMPNYRMGVEAVDLILEAIAGRDQRDIMIDDPPEIIPRESTARV